MDIGQQKHPVTPAVSLPPSGKTVFCLGFPLGARYQPETVSYLSYSSPHRSRREEKSTALLQRRWCPEGCGMPSALVRGAGPDSPPAAGRGTAAPRRPWHPFPGKVFHRHWPPAGRCRRRGGGHRPRRTPRSLSSCHRGPPRSRATHSPVVALPALVAQQQVPKPVPRGERGDLAVQVRHPARSRGTPAAAPLRRGRHPSPTKTGGRREGAGSGAEQIVP